MVSKLVKNAYGSSATWSAGAETDIDGGWTAGAALGAAEYAGGASLILLLREFDVGVGRRIDGVLRACG